jgi:uncharacterized repeat protein (TIGR03803 family)
MTSRKQTKPFPKPMPRCAAGLACLSLAMGALPLLAQAPATEIVLHNFQNPPKGANPLSGLYRDSAGNLYGTTVYGGTWGAGVVYEVEVSGRQTVLYDFTAGNDGGYPNGGVIPDGAGNLYGNQLWDHHQWRHRCRGRLQAGCGDGPGDGPVRLYGRGGWGLPGGGRDPRCCWQPLRDH